MSANALVHVDGYCLQCGKYISNIANETLVRQLNFRSFTGKSNPLSPLHRNERAAIAWSQPLRPMLRKHSTRLEWLSLIDVCRSGWGLYNYWRQRISFRPIIAVICRVCLLVPGYVTLFQLLQRLQLKASNVRTAECVFHARLHWLQTLTNIGLRISVQGCFVNIYYSFFFHFRISVDIIGIGESRTMPEITGCELALDGYRLFRKDQLDIGLEGLCYMLGAI